MEHAEVGPGDSILEIGPGKGVLTRAILEAGCKALFAIELDTRLEPFLLELEQCYPQLKVIWDDALNVDYETQLNPLPQKVIANIPYNITTPLIWKLLETVVPSGLVHLLLMVQKESAQRLCAPPSSKERYPLGITIEAMGSARKVFNVPPGAFRPVPRVESSVIEIVLEHNRELARTSSWRTLLRCSFAQRRKTLVNNLCRSGMDYSREELLKALAGFGIPSNVRAEQLTTLEWLELHMELNGPDG